MCYFFFQAEDGIRDGHVTGVQTCALPISGRREAPPHSPGRGTVERPPESQRPHHGRAATRRGDCSPHPRSEERRVGKEWRSRRAAAEEKRKKGCRKKATVGDK